MRAGTLAWAIAELMEGSVAALTCCLQAERSHGPQCGWAHTWKKEKHSWTLIERLQFTYCRDFGQVLWESHSFCSWGFYTQKQDGEIDRHRYLMCWMERTHSQVPIETDKRRGRQTALVYECAHKQTENEVNPITENHRGAYKTIRLLHFQYQQN